MTTHEEEREQLRGLQALFEKAVTDNNISCLKEHCDADFSYVSFSDINFSSFDEFETQWKKTREKMVGNGKFSTKLNPEPALFIDNIAVCHGNSNNELTNSKGEQFNFTSNWTVVFKQDGDSWKILRAHNSLNPFSNPMLKKAVKDTGIKLSLGMFILGGALGSLITFLLLR